MAMTEKQKQKAKMEARKARLADKPRPERKPSKTAQMQQEAQARKAQSRAQVKTSVAQGSSARAAGRSLLSRIMRAGSRSAIGVGLAALGSGNIKSGTMTDEQFRRAHSPAAPRPQPRGRESSVGFTPLTSGGASAPSRSAVPTSRRSSPLAPTTNPPRLAPKSLTGGSPSRAPSPTPRQTPAPAQATTPAPKKKKRDELRGGRTNANASRFDAYGGRDR